MMHPKKNWYRTQFELFDKNLDGKRAPGAQKIREENRRRFDELDFPTSRMEEWKYTNTQALLQHNFAPVPNTETVRLNEAIIQPYWFDNNAVRMVFINGHYYPEWSHVQNVPRKAYVRSLAETIRTRPELLSTHLDHHGLTSENIFTALNRSFFNDGAVIHIPDHVEMEIPVHLIFITHAPGQLVCTHPAVFIDAGAHAGVSVIQHFISADNDIYWTNTVSDIIAGPEAHVAFHKIQSESAAAFHTENRRIRQARSSRFSAHDYTLCGAWTRNHIYASLNDAYAECSLNGLYITRSQEHVDNFTVIDHAKPDCSSREVYKGILGDRSSGVFNGRIIVRKDAQHTDAKQSNHNLLLTPEATINTKPQLEIFADDVKCTHGATIGRLQDDALFYLRTRGIDERAARTILMKAFAGQVLDAVEHDGLRKHLETLVFDQLKYA